MHPIVEWAAEGLGDSHGGLSQLSRSGWKTTTCKIGGLRRVPGDW